jgi:hypothetical protein
MSKTRHFEIMIKCLFAAVQTGTQPVMMMMSMTLWDATGSGSHFCGAVPPVPITSVLPLQLGNFGLPSTPATETR